MKVLYLRLMVFPLVMAHTTTLMPFVGFYLRAQRYNLILSKPLKLKKMAYKNNVARYAMPLPSLMKMVFYSLVQMNCGKHLQIKTGTVLLLSLERIGNKAMQ